MRIAGLSIVRATPYLALAYAAFFSMQYRAEAQTPKGGAANAASGQAATAASSQASAASGASPSSGSGGLPGDSYVRDSWDTALVPPTAGMLGIESKDLAKNVVLLCYELVAGNSSTQPFILERAAITTPPQWMPGTAYAPGTLVTPVKSNGHYYKAKQVSANSGTAAPAWPVDGTTAPDGSNLSWKDMGVSAGPKLLLPNWMPGTMYGETAPAGAQVTNATNGHYYQAQPRALSGARAPSWPVNGTTVMESSSLSWEDMGLSCDNVSPSKPILMNQFLAIGIERDKTKIPDEIWNRFKILNLNITNQQGMPLIATPIRPSLSAGTASGPTGGAAAALFGFVEGAAPTGNRSFYYLTWRNQMPGDTIPTVSINLVYTPVAPALPFQPNTFYPAGAVVISTAASGSGATTNGHYYVAVNGGISGPAPAPDFNVGLVSVPTFLDGDGIAWIDMGTGPPPAGTIPWAASTPYVAGAPVTPNVPNGHWYRAQSAGTSGVVAPGFGTGGITLDNMRTTWQDLGPFTPSPPPAAGAPIPPPIPPPNCIANPPVWAATTAYAQNAVVVPPGTVAGIVGGNNHCYRALRPFVTGPNAPPFPVGGPGGSPAIEPAGVVWADAGSSVPSGGGAGGGTKVKAWAPLTAYMIGDVIQDPSSGHYYSAVQGGISGAARPPFSVPAPQIIPPVGASGPITWEDLGTTLPASVSVGTPPADQTVNLLTYTFPQSHTLSYFNLTSGIVVSSIKNRSFVNSNNPGTTMMPGTPAWGTITKGRTVDPILAVTAYVIKPMDAERPWQLRDLIPGATLGISLSAPTTNFYFGGSSELFIRNLQVVYGFSLNRVMTLDAPSVQFSPTTPVTRTEFVKGGFVGLSFNITGFIQTLIP